MDGRGKAALPGLIDCHTHPAFWGDRAAEFELRSSGASYEEIHASGGGIRSTVAATRAGNEEDLRSAVERHLGWMLEHGTTTAEAKSGYGLDRETELKSLRAIHAAGQSSPVDVYPTFLGAHTVPPEFDSAQEYVEFVIHEVLPEAAPLARFADVFLERGSFEAPEAKRYLEACRGVRARAPACTPTSSPSGVRSRWPSSSAPAAWTTWKLRSMKRGQPPGEE